MSACNVCHVNSLLITKAINNYTLQVNKSDYVITVPAVVLTSVVVGARKLDCFQKLERGLGI